MEVMQHSTSFLAPSTIIPNSPKYAVVILNQRLPRFFPLLWDHAKLRICADGGANRLFDEIPGFFPHQNPLDVRKRYKPDVIKGDMDSVRADVLDFYTNLVTCDELRSSRLFLKLLEAVLKTGNRMNVGTNRGDAYAFKLDTLLKLADVKGADGKTTLLHIVVQEIIRTEGQRQSTPNNEALNDEVKCWKLGLQMVSSLSSELTNVKKAAAMDSNILSNDVAKLSLGLTSIGEIVNLNEQTQLQESNRKFSESLN